MYVQAARLESDLLLLILLVVLLVVSLRRAGLSQHLGQLVVRVLDVGTLSRLETELYGRSVSSELSSSSRDGRRAALRVDLLTSSSFIR